MHCDVFRARWSRVDDGKRANFIKRSWQGVSCLTLSSRKLNSHSNVCTIASRNPPIESERGGRVRNALDGARR